MSRKPDINFAFQLAGKYKLTAHKVNSSGEIVSSRVVADWFDNLITDIGLDSLGGVATAAPINGCVVGTNNTPPANTDTGLGTYLAGTGTLQTNWGGSSSYGSLPYYVSYTITYRFAAGAAAGNLTEVGMCGINNSSHDATSHLFSHALIVDGSGTPITITILSNEILDVTYQINIYMPGDGSDQTGTVSLTIDGTPTVFNYTLRAAYLSNVSGLNTYVWNPSIFSSLNGIIATNSVNFSGGGYSNATALGTVDTSVPAGTNSDAWQSVSSASYTSGSYYRDLTYVMSINYGNFTFSLLSFKNSLTSLFQMLISPTITKINTKQFSITMRFSWARHA